ncbi:unnamed protein product [Rotaria sordida]|uniref:Uncharacterized protein n=1 Tax=Rotaria sordida TaxID=392033 RepID=A0A815Q1W0_9BILA|nr:unnamed protein product [Rotaria sordida]CAF1640880.1 unnamed protein product [Rotaria sordida]
MKHLSAKQREECIEYVKRKILFFDIDHHVKSPSSKKPVSLSTSTSSIYITDFYLNTEIYDGDYADQFHSSEALSDIIEIDLYLKHGTDKTTSVTNSGQEVEKYNPL